MSDDDGASLRADEVSTLGLLAERVARASPEVVLPDDVLRQLFTAAVTQYSARYEQEPDTPPLVAADVTATDVATCSIEMLKVVDLQLFELTLWGSRIPQD
ncbi:MAG: hypothetical protein GEV07_01705 [Streptosporangiales bacterium]|nr:hypothetical protein [Streptosporangiales bacterium]